MRPGASRRARPSARACAESELSRSQWRALPDACDRSRRIREAGRRQSASPRSLRTSRYRCRPALRARRSSCGRRVRPRGASTWSALPPAVAVERAGLRAHAVGVRERGAPPGDGPLSAPVVRPRRASSACFPCRRRRERVRALSRHQPVGGPLEPSRRWRLYHLPSGIARVTAGAAQTTSACTSGSCLL